MLVMNLIVIDPGHGGDDIGGGSNQFWKEKDLALKISKYQFDRFQELGIPVKMTRYGDENLSPYQRVLNAKNAFGVDNSLLISNHINSSSSGFDGAEFIYSYKDNPDLANKLAKEFMDKGQNINRIYSRRNSNGEDYYYIIRNTYPMKSILIEYGFANSNGDDIDQLNNEWEKLAEATVKAVSEYLGYNYTKPSDKAYYLYTVQNNDSLYKIKDKTGVSINTIKEYNDLKTDLIYPNQILKIPYLRVSDLYITEENDTIFNISRKLNIPIDILISKSNILDIPIKSNQNISFQKNVKNAL